MLLGSSFAVATGGLGWLGHLGDVKYDTEPWLALLGISIGFVYGGYEVWKLTREASTPSSETISPSDPESPIESTTPPPSS